MATSLRCLSIILNVEFFIVIFRNENFMKIKLFLYEKYFFNLLLKNSYRIIRFSSETESLK